MRSKIIEQPYTYFDRLQIKIVNFISNQAVIATTFVIMLIVFGMVDN